MEIKTSKIKEIKSIGDPWGQLKIMYHKLIMENGDKLDIGKLEKQEVGSELTYYFTGDLGQQEYTKAKTPSKSQIEGKTYNSNTQSSTKNNNTDLTITRLALIKAAASYHAGRNTTGDDVLADAKLWEPYVLDKEDNNEVPF